MTNFPMISPLSDTELDAVTGGCLVGAYQNAKGHDMIVRGANGVSVATKGAGGVAMSGVGGAATSSMGSVARGSVNLSSME